MNDDSTVEEYLRLFGNCRAVLRDDTVILELLPEKYSESYSIIEQDSKADRDVLRHNFTFQESHDIHEVELDRSRLFELFTIRFYVDDNHFLENNTEHLNSDEYIYIWSKSDSLLDNEWEPFLLAFRNYIDFKDFVFNLADHRENDNEVLLYLSPTDFYSVQNYSGALIQSRGDLDKLLSVAYNYSDDDGYAEEFKLICKREIVKYLRAVNQNSLDSLANRFESFFLDLMNNYQVFLARFSFDQIKDDFLEEKSRYRELIDKNVNDTFKVIYSIPLGIGLTLTINFLENETVFSAVVILLSFLLYTTSIVGLLIHNISSSRINRKYVIEQKQRIEEDLRFNEYLYRDDFVSTFNLLGRKITLVQVSSSLILVFLLGISILFIIRVLIVFPEIEATLKKFLDVIEAKKGQSFFVKASRLLY